MQLQLPSQTEQMAAIISLLAVYLTPDPSTNLFQKHLPKKQKWKLLSAAAKCPFLKNLTFITWKVCLLHQKTLSCRKGNSIKKIRFWSNVPVLTLIPNYIPLLTLHSKPNEFLLSYWERERCSRETSWITMW